VFVVLVMLATIAASTLVFRSQWSRFRRTWKRLSPAVPDPKALEAAPYRIQSESTALEPTSRTALSLLPATRRARSFQAILALAAGPMLAGVFAAFPTTSVLAISAAIGGVLGVANGAALLRDNRESLVAVALASLPLAFFSPIAAGANFILFALSRYALDRKDNASKDEAERERIADPRYLTMSREGRAAGIARSRSGSGGGESTDSSARDNMTV
jgi:hypothetical protein